MVEAAKLHHIAMTAKHYSDFYHQYVKIQTKVQIKSAAWID